jgi:hypothetical protein
MHASARYKHGSSQYMILASSQHGEGGRGEGGVGVAEAVVRVWR